MAYLEFQKKGQNFTGHPCLHKGGQTIFCNFFYGEKKMLPEGPWPNGPPKYATAVEAPDHNGGSDCLISILSDWSIVLSPVNMTSGPHTPIYDPARNNNVKNQY